MQMKNLWNLFSLLWFYIPESTTTCKKIPEFRKGSGGAEHRWGTFLGLLHVRTLFKIVANRLCFAPPYLQCTEFVTLQKASILSFIQLKGLYVLLAIHFSLWFSATVLHFHWWSPGHGLNNQSFKIWWFSEREIRDSKRNKWDQPFRKLYTKN